MVEFALTPVTIVNSKLKKEYEYLSGRYCRITDARTTCMSMYFWGILLFCASQNGFGCLVVFGLTAL